MLESTSNCRRRSSRSNFNFCFVRSQNKEVNTHSQQRHSDLLIEDRVFKNKNIGSYMNLCPKKDHKLSKVRMRSISSINSSSGQLVVSSPVSKKNYRRSQSNSIFELCSCLSTSSLSSANSS